MIEFLKAVLRGESLSRERAFRAMELILSGGAEPEQIGAFLVALQGKRESVDEIVGFAQAVCGQATTFSLDRDVIDVCGTGGDGANTFNVSTTAAFVIAASGQAVAKHGNRAVSSRSGSFDVLDSLRVPFASDQGQVLSQVDEFGLSFMFAPNYHPVLKKLARLRRNLGVRTVFNLLGPLLNPARVKRQLVGVFSDQILGQVAAALSELGATEAMVVCGNDGLDELTVTGPTKVAHLRNGRVDTYMLTPEDCGLRSAPLDALCAGGDAAQNARILESILRGERGVPRDLVLINSAAALVVGGKAADLKEGVERAVEAIDSGRAVDLLNRMRVQPDRERRRTSE